MQDPFHLRPWEIARLTDAQLAAVYFRPRDKQGRPVPAEDAAAPSAGLTYWEVFEGVWRDRGLSDAEIAAKWEAEGHGGEVVPDSDWD